MISFAPVDNGLRRIVRCVCDNPGCAAVDTGNVQTVGANGEWPDHAPVMSRLGWLTRDGKHYCSRFCADKHAYTIARAMPLSPVLVNPDTSLRVPPPRGEPSRPAPNAGGKRQPAIAPRVSR